MQRPPIRYALISDWTRRWARQQDSGLCAASSDSNWALGEFGSLSLVEAYLSGPPCVSQLKPGRGSAVDGTRPTPARLTGWPGLL